MAVSLVSTRVERTNSLVLTFDGDLDQASFELGAGTLAADDGGDVPDVIGFSEVPARADQVRIPLDAPLRLIGYTFTYTGLADDAGDPVAGAATFMGLLASSPVKTVWDRRLKRDLAFGETVGGDAALLVGDAWLREQAIRLHTWPQGTLLADTEWGVPWREQGPLGGRELAALRRASERALLRLPGVRAAKTTLILQGDILRIRCEIRTDQTMLEVSAQRLLGR